MVRIKLKRHGRRHDPFYRIVVADSRKATKVIEELGHYHPKRKELTLDVVRVRHWMSHGAQPSDSAKKFIAQAEKLPIRVRLLQNDPVTGQKEGEEMMVATGFVLDVLIPEGKVELTKQTKSTNASSSPPESEETVDGDLSDTKEE